MIKKINIEFDGPDKDGLNDMQVQELNAALDRAIDITGRPQDTARCR